MVINRPQSILVAVDFGEASGRAISIGGAVADRCDAALRLLHAGAFDVPPYIAGRERRDEESTRQSDRNRATEFLASFGRRYTSAPFTTVVDDGAPVDTILQEGKTSDLVVMGTHGRRGLSRWWLGSVAERVLRETTGPLLIARAQMDASPAEEAFKRILVHASAPLKGAAAMRYAAMLTGCFNGVLADARYEPLEPALARTAATLLAVSTPAVKCGAWLTNIGEPIVRFCEPPIVFVPEFDVEERR